MVRCVVCFFIYLIFLSGRVLKVEAECVKDFGTFLRVHHLLVGKHGLLVAALYCEATISRYCCLLKSVPVDKFNSSNLALLEVSGFCVTQIEENVCEVVASFRVSSGNVPSSEFVSALLSNLQDRCDEVQKQRKPYL